ncbi:MAG: ATP-binding protein [Rhodospirillaceae bacterium]|nr:ATP-binding protein [Rhodospirillaceae bacterium]
MALLSVRGLRTDLIGPIDLDVDRGDCVLVSGPSGSGKTLFLRAIADLDPNQGTVTLSERSRERYTGPAWRRDVTYVAAEPGWWTDRAGDHFDDPGTARTWLPRLGLGDDALDKAVSVLSTGERLRLAILRAAVQQPSVLLLDEPTAALDPAATGMVADLLRAALAEGLALIVVSHQEDAVARLARRRLALRQGRFFEEAA